MSKTTRTPKTKQAETEAISAALSALSQEGTAQWVAGKKRIYVTPAGHEIPNKVKNALIDRGWVRCGRGADSNAPTERRLLLSEKGLKAAEAMLAARGVTP